MRLDSHFFFDLCVLEMKKNEIIELIRAIFDPLGDDILEVIDFGYLNIPDKKIRSISKHDIFFANILDMHNVIAGDPNCPVEQHSMSKRSRFG